MFNSTIVDVAIGMIFIYLLLSLMCTAASEIIELMLKKKLPWRSPSARHSGLIC